MLISNQTKKSSLSEQAYLKIKKQIISGKLSPGEKLKETKLAETLEISRTPIREALKRLEMEGLVSIHSSQGMEVTNFTPKAMFSLFECNSVLEGLAAKKAAENIDEYTITFLEETLFLSDKYFGEGNLEKVVEKNTVFHDTIVQASDNASLIHLMTLMRSQILAYRSFISSFYFRSSFSEEHKNIFNAIKSNDGELSELLMREHIIKDYEAIYSQIGNYFNEKE